MYHAMHHVICIKNPKLPKNPTSPIPASSCLFHTRSLLLKLQHTVTVMSTFEEAPSLPREPTIIRMEKPDPPPRPPSPPTTTIPKRPTKDLPLPPRFPSINDVADWPDAPAPAPNPPDVAWNRPSDPPAPPTPPTDSPTPEPPARTSLIAKIKALFTKKKNASSDEAPAAKHKTPAKPAIVKAKEAICKLPDPTLIFVFEACVILLIHTFKPHLLRTWPARIIIPLLLVPTVVATALWRRTIVIATPGRTIASIVKPIPDAGKVVTQGEVLRAREMALLKAEHQLRRNQMRLEVLRKEIEGRLPPQVSIANLLKLEANAKSSS